MLKNSFQNFFQFEVCLALYFFFRNLGEFGKLIAVSIETLLSFCDDEDEGVRVAAGDCINRIIKVRFDQ